MATSFPAMGRSRCLEEDDDDADVADDDVEFEFDRATGGRAGTVVWVEVTFVDSSLDLAAGAPIELELAQTQVIP